MSEDLLESKKNRNALPPGHQLQEYRVEAVLGYGGFGITYLAKDIHLEQQVAIKEYLPNAYAVREGVSTVYAKCSEDEEAFQWGLQRFILEARTLARFHHPAIVKVMRFFEENQTAYMVMAYQQGESLADILKLRTLDEKELLDIILPLLDGLEQIHAAGFLHRDIKPSNIFIRKDSQPVLLDFGSARYAVGSKTCDLTSIVSPGYAPFEQYDPKTEQGGWTDIYALGAVMYHMMIGQPPPEVVGRLRHDQMVRAVEAGVKGYRQSTLQAVDWALALDEQARPQSIAEWREALLADSADVSSSLQTHPERRSTHSQYWSRRMTGFFMLFVLFTAAVVGGTLLYQQTGGSLLGLPSFTPPPATITPSSPPAAQTRLTPERIDGFITSYFQAVKAGDINALMSHYAENVDYYEWGPINKAPIRQEKSEYFERWPEITYTLVSEPQIIDTPSPDEKIVEFVFNFLVHNPDEQTAVQGVTGESKYTWRIGVQPDRLIILMHKEKVLSRRKLYE